MDEGIRPGLGRGNRELKGFGWGLAGLLSVFALLSWRGEGAAWRWLAPLAALTGLSASLAPAVFGPLYRLWMPPARALGRANASVAIFLLYFLVLTPYAFILRLLGADLLDLGLRRRESYWRAKEPSEGLRGYERQF